MDPTRIQLDTNPASRRMSGVTMHGNLSFSVPYMTEIAPNLWQGGCENGLILPTTIKHLVSLYPWESYTVNHPLRSKLEVEMFDSLDQAMDQVDVIADWVNLCRRSGPVLVHCQAGLNRSSLITVTALVKTGLTANEAITQVREKRSTACLCNPAFEAWLRER